MRGWRGRLGHRERCGAQGPFCGRGGVGRAAKWTEAGDVETSIGKPTTWRREVPLLFLPDPAADLPAMSCNKPAAC